MSHQQFVCYAYTCISQDFLLKKQTEVLISSKCEIAWCQPVLWFFLQRMINRQLLCLYMMTTTAVHKDW